MYNYNSNPYLNNYNLPNYTSPQQRLNQLEQQYPQYNNYYNNQNNIQNQNVTWIQVNGIKGAKEHIVQPNTTAWLMDNNDSVFFVKSADNLGVTTLKCYKFFEIDPQSDKNVSSNDYVSLKDFNALQARLNQLETYITNMKQEQQDKPVNSKQQIKK